MWSAGFWARTAERVVSSAVGGLLGALGTTTLVQDVDWRIALGTAGAAALVAFCKALVARSVGDPEDPALLPAGVGSNAP